MWKNLLPGRFFHNYFNWVFVMYVMLHHARLTRWVASIAHAVDWLRCIFESILLLDQFPVEGVIFKGDVKGAVEAPNRHFEAFGDPSVKINCLGRIENNWDVEITIVYDSAQMVQSLPDVVVRFRQLLLHLLLEDWWLTSYA